MTKKQRTLINEAVAMITPVGKIRTSIYVAFMLALILTDFTAYAEIGVDGMCNFFALAPFASVEGSPFYGLSGSTTNNIGFSQTAAALLAIKHFNSRNATIVPEIADIPNSCNITLNMTKVFNAVPNDYSAIRSIARDGVPNCAFVGPYDDATVFDIKAVAQAYSIPLVTTGTFDVTVVSDVTNQFTSSVNPDLASSAQKITSYLMYKNRNNFIAILYDGSAINLQRREALRVTLELLGIKSMSSSFSVTESDNSPRSVLKAMQRIKASGYRTIVLAQSNPLFSYQRIADAAEALGMNTGDYFYLWYDIFDPSIYRQNNTNVTKLTLGSVWIAPLSLYYVDKEDAFLSAWREQGASLVNTAMALNPFGPGEAGFVNASSDFFQTNNPEYGSAQMFDAVISVGLGACAAQQISGGSVVNGSEHQTGIRKSSFYGATGRVEFGETAYERWGTRRGGYLVWAAINFIGDLSPQFADIMNLGNVNDSWVPIAPFIYADGTTNPPTLLRDQPDQNYLSNGLRIAGLSLMGITMALAIICGAWVFIRRKHKILAASQPIFLYMICFGAIVQTSAIIPLSYDESYGWNTQQLDRACMAYPWLLTFGHTIVYSPLFTKLWRVNKVLQFTRRKIKLKHVAWPMGILVLSALVVLLLWTTLDPLRWTREEIDDVTGESVGKCNSETSWAFVGPLIFVMLIPSVLTGYMAYKTKDVDEAYAESGWIFTMIILQIQILIIAIPVLVMMQEDPDGRYIGQVGILVIVPLSTLCLIFFPKVVAYRASLHAEDGTPKYKRGARGKGRVSGVPSVSGASEQHPTSAPHTPPHSTVLPNVEEEDQFDDGDKGQNKMVVLEENPEQADFGSPASSQEEPIQVPP